jgi:hypothetical protein
VFGEIDRQKLRSKSESRSLHLKKLRSMLEWCAPRRRPPRRDA